MVLNEFETKVIENLENPCKIAEMFIEKMDKKIKEYVSKYGEESLWYENEIRRDVIRDSFYGIISVERCLGSYTREKEKIKETYYSPLVEPVPSSGGLVCEGMYTNYDAAIQPFLETYNLFENLERIGFLEKIEPDKAIEYGVLDPEIEIFLISNGYLYPRDEDLIVHRNWIAAGHNRRPKIGRDLARCIVFSIEKEESRKVLEDRKKAWQYFRELHALSLAYFPEHSHYYADGTTSHFYLNRDKKGKEEYLELGRAIASPFCVELEPKDEKFEWPVEKRGFRENLTETLERICKNSVEKYNEEVAGRYLEDLEEEIGETLKCLAKNYSTGSGLFLKYLESEGEELKKNKEEEQEWFETLEKEKENGWKEGSFYRKSYYGNLTLFRSDEFRAKTLELFNKIKPELESFQPVERVEDENARDGYYLKDNFEEKLVSGEIKAP